MRGVAPMTPDPKMHINSLANQVGGPHSMYNTWFEAEARHKDFRDLKHHDLASPMFMPGIIKESPRPPP